MAAKELNVIEAQIVELGNHERITKALIAQTAVDCLEHLHEHGQQALCNKMLLVLTPANAKAVFKFFKAFSGFAMSKEEGMTKKIKPIMEGELVKKDIYVECTIAFRDFVQSGGNFWLWWNAQNKMPKPEASKLDLKKVTEQVKKFAAKAEKEGISKIALFNAVVADVFSPEDLLNLLDQMVANKVAEVKEEAKA